VFSFCSFVRACVIDLGNHSKSPKITISDIRASGFLGIGGVDHSLKIQSSVSFGGKDSTSSYLNLFPLTSFHSCIVFSGDCIRNKPIDDEDRQYLPIEDRYGEVRRHG